MTTVANSTGEAVVQYFSGQTDVNPDACGSFVRMENDNSELAGACDQWRYGDGKWGWLSRLRRDESRLYIYPAFFYHNRYDWMLQPDNQDLRCDDQYYSGVSTDDFWKVFVR